MADPLFTPNTQDQKRYWEVHTNSRRYDDEVVSFFANQRIEYLQKWLDFSGVDSALEVGCGDGFASHPMSSIVCDMVGGDISELCLERNPLGNDRLVLFDAESLPFADCSFDMSFCWEILHHVQDPTDVIREMARIARKYVIIFEPNRYNPAQFLFGLLKPEERGTLNCSNGTLRRSCESAGLSVIHAQNVGCISPNATPVALFKILKHVPFVLPLIGISCVLICAKTDADADADA